MASVFKIDITLTNWINSFIPHNQLFTFIFSFFSLRGGSIIIWIVIVGLLIFFEEKIDRKFILYFAISVSIAFLVTTGLKRVIQRPRPTYTVNNKMITCDKDFSFPSGHATTAFAAAVVLAAFNKKRRYIYFAIAVLVSLSRIYLHCHYFLDVVAGGIIGALSSLIVLKFKDEF